MAYSDFAIADGALAGEQLYRLGLVYSTGQGVCMDLVEAHKWFNLAALRGFAAAKTCRKEVAEQMTSSQIAEAQRAAREWLRVR